jgi:hypothetical protein
MIRTGYEIICDRCGASTYSGLGTGLPSLREQTGFGAFDGEDVCLTCQHRAVSATRKVRT